MRSGVDSGRAGMHGRHSVQTTYGRNAPRIDHNSPWETFGCRAKGAARRNAGQLRQPAGKPRGGVSRIGERPTRFGARNRARDDTAKGQSPLLLNRCNVRIFTGARRTGVTGNAASGRVLADARRGRVDNDKRSAADAGPWSMISSDLPRLRRTGLLDAPNEERFDRLTRLACRLLRVPIALVWRWCT